MATRMFALINLNEPVKQVSFTDEIPPDIWSVDCGYLVGSFK